VWSIKVAFIPSKFCSQVRLAKSQTLKLTFVTCSFGGELAVAEEKTLAVEPHLQNTWGPLLCQYNQLYYIPRTPSGGKLLHPRCRIASSPLSLWCHTQGLVARWWVLSSSGQWKCY